VADRPLVAGCAFCSQDAETNRTALWEGERYRILADEYPRCAGHVLLVTRAHLPSHMHAPEAWMPEFYAAQEQVRRFLRATFAHSAFYENGGARQEVPHAHLHGLPFAPEVPAAWTADGWIEPIASWEDARRERERSGHYFYLETDEGRWLVRRYKKVLNGVRGQLVGQTEARIDPTTGKMTRGGPEMVAQTAALWRAWEATHAD
jgi:diadenosine tetraphosphate (Ap4A) HIT family hydrolase